MFLTVFLSNCQKNKVIKTHGIFYLQNRAVLLKVQSSNRNDVIKILGKPHSKSLHEPNTWIYIERTRTRGNLIKLGRTSDKPSPETSFNKLCGRLSRTNLTSAEAKSSW